MPVFCCHVLLQASVACYLHKESIGTSRAHGGRKYAPMTHDPTLHFALTSPAWPPGPGPVVAHGSIWQLLLRGYGCWVSRRKVAHRGGATHQVAGQQNSPCCAGKLNKLGCLFQVRMPPFRRRCRTKAGVPVLRVSQPLRGGGAHWKECHTTSCACSSCSTYLQIADS